MFQIILSDSYQRLSLLAWLTTRHDQSVDSSSDRVDQSDHFSDQPSTTRLRSSLATQWRRPCQPRVEWPLSCFCCVVMMDCKRTIHTFLGQKSNCLKLHLNLLGLLWIQYFHIIHDVTVVYISLCLKLTGILCHLMGHDCLELAPTITDLSSLVGLSWVASL